MVNFQLVYKPYSISKETEHEWTMYRNMKVFERVLADKNSNNVNMDTQYLKLHSVTIEYSAIIYLTNTIVTIVTHLIERNKQYERG